MKLWVDDERKAPDGWAWCRDARSALFKILEWHLTDKLTVISMDYDLGAGTPNGYDLLYCMARLGLKVPTILVHSQNPDGKRDMEAFIERMELQG